MKSFIPRKFTNTLLHGMIALPLAAGPNWQSFSFSDKPKNKIIHSKEALTIQVSHSASPYVYKFDAPKKISMIKLEASVDALVKLQKGAKQGQKGYDDFALRLGLILKGGGKLNWVQRQMAPKWLTEMEKLLPSGIGVDKVHFLTTCLDQNFVNKEVTHFLDPHLTQKCRALLLKPGPFTLKEKFKNPPEVVGLWLASDGDDTNSEFNLQIHSIQIKEANEPHTQQQKVPANKK